MNTRPRQAPAPTFGNQLLYGSQSRPVLGKVPAVSIDKNIGI
jgi:hypothetical protein